MNPVGTGIAVAMAASCLSAGGAAQQPRATTEACDRATTITEDGIGPLRVGMAADSMKRVCRVVSSSAVPQYSLIVYDVVVGGDTVRANEQSGVVRSIEVRSPRFRTADSLGVGMAAARLADLPDMSGGPGDGNDTFVIARKGSLACGLAFWLDAETATMLNSTKGDPLRLLAMRGMGTVTQVNIHGSCQR